MKNNRMYRTTEQANQHTTAPETAYKLHVHRFTAKPFLFFIALY
jgi:hypothetical protein